MNLKKEDAWNIPFSHPCYPALPAHYRDVRFHYVFFHADPAAVGHILPAPLEPHAEGLCAAHGIEVPFCSNYGPFEEAIVHVQCRFRGQDGWYLSHAFHNGPAGIAAGREIYGTPKVHADMDVKQQGRAMVTTARLAGLPVVTVASTMETLCDFDQMPVLKPSWRLKLIPRVDGPGAAIKQLIDGSVAAKDRKPHVMYRGTGTVEFSPNPLCDLTDLKPLECLDAFYMESSYTEGYAKIEYDYLAEA